MNTRLIFPLLILFVFISGACQDQESDWTPVFNGENLDNWDTYIGAPYEGYEAEAENVTADQVFSVVEMEGQPAMKIDAPVKAAIATRDDYENYHLKMEYRWGENVYDRRNSGLLYHSYGAFGSGLETWKNAHELQLWEDNVGDSYRMGETYCEIPVVTEGENYVYSPEGEMTPFGMGEESKIARKTSNVENPPGEWNSIELYCVGRQSVHVVNGEPVLVNYKSGKYENGEVVPLTAGKIQFQAEGAEMYIRNLQVRSITEIPASVMP